MRSPLKTFAVGLLAAALVLHAASPAKAFSLFTGLGELAKLTILEGAAGLLTKAAEMAKDVKEQTTLLKTAYKGVDALANGSWRDASDELYQGLSRNPELAGLYRDVRDISDLRYTNAQAEQTINNMLFAHVFGPAVDYLHSQAEDMNTLSNSAEMRVRHGAIRNGEGAIANGLDAACDEGPGGCAIAGNRAAIESLRVLGDLHEVMERNQRVAERILEQTGQAERSTYYVHHRAIEDLLDYTRAVFGLETNPICRPGHCIEDEYAGARYRVLREARERVYRKEAAARYSTRGMYPAPTIYAPPS